MIVQKTTLLDDILGSESYGTESYVQACYDEACKITKNPPFLSTKKKDLAWFDDKEHLRELRNSVSFMIKGIEEAQKKGLNDLGFRGVLNLWDILQVCFQTKYGGLFLPAVERAIAHVKGMASDSVDIMFELFCTFSEALFKAKSATSRDFEIVPWPSEEEWTKLVSGADEKIISSLQAALGLLKKISYSQAGSIKLSKIYSTIKSSKSVTVPSNLQDQFSTGPATRNLVKVHSLNDTENADSIQKILLDAESEVNSQTYGERAFAFLIDIAEVAVNCSNYDIAERILAKFPFSGSLERNLLVIQIEVEKLKQLKDLKKTEIRRLLSSLQSLIAKARGSSYDAEFIHKCCIASWKVMNDLNLLQESTRPGCCDLLKSICETAERVPGIDRKIVSCFEQELALCYENQNIFSLAILHAEKALGYLEQFEKEKSADIELLLNRLWIKGNTFDGILKPEQKALSLADQAKYISEPNLIHKMLEKSLKTVITDHELVLSSNSSEFDALLQNNYRINFDSIGATSPNSRRLVQAALSDILRQARTCAKSSSDTDGICSLFWKMVLDSSGYLLSKQWNYSDEDVALSKLQAEALNARGEALVFFVGLANRKVNDAFENITTANRLICENFLASFSAGCRMKDSNIINLATSNLWTFYNSLQPSFLKSNIGLWLDVLHSVYEGLIENGQQGSSLFVLIATCYARTLREHHETISASTNVEEKIPSPTKTKLPNLPKPSAIKSSGTKESNISNPLKTAEDVCNTGLLSNCRDYDAKLSLFDMRTSLRSLVNLGPLPETDIVLRLFSAIDGLDSNKKTMKEDIENAIVDLTKADHMLSRNLSWRLWLRVIRYSLKVQQYQIAFFSINALTKDNYKDMAVIHACEIELLYGSAIINLANAGLFYGNEASIRLDALSRFGICVKLACSPGNLCLAEIIQALEACESALSEKVFYQDRTLTLSIMESITKTLSQANFKNPRFHEALLTDSALQKLVTFTFTYCIEIYSSTLNWQMALQTMEKLFRIMPQSMHQALAKRKLQLLSESGKSIAVTFLKDADLNDQIHIWKLLAGKPSDWNKKYEAYSMLIDALRTSVSNGAHPTPLISTLLILASLQYRKRNDETQALTLLQEADDLIQKSFQSPAEASDRLLSSIYSNVVKGILQRNTQRGVAFYLECCPLLLQYIKLAHESFVQALFETQGAKQQQPSKKGKDTNIVAAEADIPDPQNIEKWLSFEWPATFVAYLQENCQSLQLSQIILKDVRIFFSSVLQAVIKLREQRMYSQCIPLLLGLELIAVTHLEISQRESVLSVIYLVMATIFSALHLSERAAKKYMQFWAVDLPGEESNVWPWHDTESSDSDIGFPLGLSSILVLKARCYIYRMEIKKAKLALLQIFPNAPKNGDSSQEAVIGIITSILTRLLNFKSVTESFSSIEVLNLIVESTFASVLWIKCAANTTDLQLLLSTINSQIAADDYKPIKSNLLSLKYEILAKTDIEFSNIDQMSEVLKDITEAMREIGNKEASTRMLLRHAMFMRDRRVFGSDTERIAWYLNVIDLMESAKSYCDTVSDVNSVAPLRRAITVEICETLLRCLNFMNEGQSVKTEDPVKIALEEFFRSDETTAILKKWASVTTSAREQIKTLLLPVCPMLTGKALAKALRILALSYLIPGSKASDAKSAETYFSGSIRISLEYQDYATVAVCAEELFRIQPLNDSSSIISLSLLQCCANASYLLSLCKRQIGLQEKPVSFFTSPDELNCDMIPSEPFKNSLYLATIPSWQRCLAPTLSAEALQEFPKGFKVILLQVSSDRKNLYIGILSRSADVGRNKTHAEDIEVKTWMTPIDYKWLKRIVSDLTSDSAENGLNETQEVSLKELADYFQPMVIQLSEGDVETAKIPEKADKKKGISKEEPGAERHCIICTDENFEQLPLEYILSGSNFTTISRDFGLNYVLNRHRQDPAKKKDKEKQVEQSDIPLVSFQTVEAYKSFRRDSDSPTDKIIFGKEAAAVKLFLCPT
ncbi:hypothetical protein HDU67_008948 [Dinochytrium kinnereticum]|nr:hypothetical protein HDU67_008948 [Dinochytrium kinnereticum]